MTVIGAMIVAPLMTPFLGSALALVLVGREHVVRSALLVLGGALAVVAVGMLLGRLVSPPDAFASNSQFASGISPRPIDLLAALATGTVGAFALCAPTSGFTVGRPRPRPHRAGPPCRRAVGRHRQVADRLRRGP